MSGNNDNMGAVHIVVTEVSIVFARYLQCNMASIPLLTLVIMFSSVEGLSHFCYGRCKRWHAKPTAAWVRSFAHVKGNFISWCLEYYGLLCMI